MSIQIHMSTSNKNLTTDKYNKLNITPNSVLYPFQPVHERLFVSHYPIEHRYHHTLLHHFGFWEFRVFIALNAPDSQVAAVCVAWPEVRLVFAGIGSFGQNWIILHLFRICWISLIWTVVWINRVRSRFLWHLFWGLLQVTILSGFCLCLDWKRRRIGATHIFIYNLYLYS